MMKNLKEYIKEGLFDDLDKIEKIGGMEHNAEQVKKEIYNWLCKNTRVKIFKNKLKYNFTDDGIIVDYAGDIVFNDIESLTNGLFQWGEVGGGFYCNGCRSLKSLEGGPKKVGENFTCNYCLSLESLEGAPEEVGGYFNCFKCKIQFTEEDVKKVSKVKKKINCI